MHCCFVKILSTFSDCVIFTQHANNILYNYVTTHVSVLSFLIIL